MKLFPAIDLFGGRAVRLFKGDYNQMTVYNEDPVAVAREFEACGAKQVHLVDLEGAKDGTTPHLELVARIVRETSLFVEIGGGIRSMETAKRYMECGVKRIILGTAAVTDRPFLLSALEAYPDAVAVGVDLKDGLVAVHGWTQKTGLEAMSFCREMESLGVKNLICTDISKDGAMQGTNRALYRTLSQTCKVDITASGGVSDLSDIVALRELGLYGAILGKAYYTGAVDLREALEAAE